MEKKYKTSQIFKIMGLSRDTLRHYEKEGIIAPTKDKDNHYRQFQFKDIYTLLVTGFYKKRGLTLKEIKEVKAGYDADQLQSLLIKKQQKLRDNIKEQERMIKEIEQTLAFTEMFEQHLNNFTIQDFPFFEVSNEFSDFHNIDEYYDLVRDQSPLRDYPFSNLIRLFKFDEAGLLNTKMLIADEKRPSYILNKNNTKSYSKCVYTVVEDGEYKNQDEDITEDIIRLFLDWAKQEGIEPIGEAYGRTRLITYCDQKERIFIEVFFPIK
ncbi:hypothetical protein ATZ33_00710 [Enterococcus silesiacus]|uniref:HTH merR-type domain-containing protein n=2 Tax=Enterococcus silesiacus TaxID=332949 RepID=A0ABM5W4T5_9ENTE|nr:MerR family transcriptional regulator [Enterococcus silesiacus]ALR99952.1 hypothetical protein ATZ33_00710 [Enterococcus silesiacus]